MLNRYVARIYTPGKCGPDTHFKVMMVQSLRQAKQLAKALADDINGRLVSVWEDTKGEFTDSVMGV